VKDIMAEILWKSSQVKERTINSFFNWRGHCTIDQSHDSISRYGSHFLMSYLLARRQWLETRKPKARPGQSLLEAVKLSAGDAHYSILWERYVINNH
jgi:hypothetical protein